MIFYIILTHTMYCWLLLQTSSVKIKDFVYIIYLCVLYTYVYSTHPVTAIWQPHHRNLATPSPQPGNPITAIWQPHHRNPATPSPQPGNPITATRQPHHRNLATPAAEAFWPRMHLGFPSDGTALNENGARRVHSWQDFTSYNKWFDEQTPPE